MLSKWLSRSRERVRIGSRRGFPLLPALAAVGLWSPLAHAATYHVRADVGHNGNDGLSPGSAFKTIQKGADEAQPGDMVMVYAGVYRERVKPPRGGTGEDARITYLAKPGDYVLITGLDPWAPSWTQSGSYPNLYYATPPDSMFTDTNYVDGGNPFKISYGDAANGAASLGQVVVDGVEYAEKTSQTEANNATQSWYVNRTSGRIYINFGGSPSGHNVEIVTRRGVFRPFLKGLGYITVQGFDLAYCGNHPCVPGVLDTLHPRYQNGMICTRQGHHWKIIGNRIRNAKGVGLTFSLGTDIEDFHGWDPHAGVWEDPLGAMVFHPHAEIANPIVWDGDNEIDPLNPTEIQPSRPFKEVGHNIIANNVIENCGMNAIAGIGSMGNTLYGNRFSNNCRFISSGSAEDAIIKMHIQYFTLIERNLFENSHGKRMLWLDNNVTAAVVSRNVFLNQSGSAPAVFFEIMSSPDQYLTLVDNNLFINCEHGMVSAVADGVGLYNNLFFRCGDGFSMGSDRTPMTGGDCGNMRIHSWNNLFVDQQRAFGYAFNQDVNFHTSDYNLMYRPDGVTFCKYLLTRNGTGDGGDRASRPWCTTDYEISDITAARSGGGSWWEELTSGWGASNCPRGCEADLAYWRGTMGANIDLHSLERPYPGASYGSHTTRTITLNLGSDPSIPGAPARDGTRTDFLGNVIEATVKAGCFQDLASGLSVFTFWDDANLPPLPSLPTTPSGLVVTTLSPTTMKVSWNYNAPDARFMHIERRINGGEWQFWGNITTTQNEMLDYADTMDTSANFYEYRVATRNAAGLSQFAYVETGVPSLNIRMTMTNTAVISWPAPSTGWQLQQNSSIGAMDWVTTPEAVNSDGSNNFITVTLPTRVRFYRLAKPLPVAEFSGTPATGTAPLTVNFTEAALNGPTAWFWTFGNGGTSTARNPTHQYTSAGNYTVSLTVSNVYGSDIETKTNYITVNPPQPPVADFTGNPASGARPLTVNFTDASINNPTGWFWTFGDGGTSTDQNPDHQYASAGNYTVSLTVSNAADTDTETRVNYISVTNAIGGLPEPWLNQDIGATGAAGSVGVTSGTFTIEGAGFDMWGNSDSLHYVYQPASGECSITVRVVTQENTRFWAKAGVNIRETLTGGSKSAYMVITPDDRSAFGWRSSTGGSTSDANGGDHPAPYWVRLVRSGNSFSAYESPDGSSWTQVGATETISMATDVYIGLAVCSASSGTLGAATIENVTCNP